MRNLCSSICVKAVDKLSTKLVQLGNFYTQSTTTANKPSVLSRLTRNLCAIYPLPFAQPKSDVIHRYTPSFTHNPQDLIILINNLYRTLVSFKQQQTTAGWLTNYLPFFGVVLTTPQKPKQFSPYPAAPYYLQKNTKVLLKKGLTT